MPNFVFATLIALAGSLVPTVSAAQPEQRTADEPDMVQYDFTTLIAKPGKLDAVHDWLRAHQEDVFAKHGATNIAYLVPAGPNPDNKILAIHRYPSMPALLRASRDIKADPLWKPMDTAENTPDLLLEEASLLRLTTTDYSPDFTPTKSPEPRIFELRTYTCPSPEKLFYLHDRFRKHTMKLFTKHGMENLIYWHPMDGELWDVQLVYLLAHGSEAAAKESFANFRADPDWIAAKKASEEKAGGSLTNPDKGVVSEFFLPTDYSPLR